MEFLRLLASDDSNQNFLNILKWKIQITKVYEMNYNVFGILRNSYKGQTQFILKFGSLFFNSHT